jgi:N-succinyldiaminopimelate aminotransferase
VPSRRAPYLTAKLQGFGTTIFAEMSALATATGSVNLGQGFPDTDGPRVVLDAAIDAINGGLNQYPPGPGMPVLRQAVSAHQQRFYGLQYDPDTEVLVTAGATEGLAAALLGLLDTGDEVIAFERLDGTATASGIGKGSNPMLPALFPSVGKMIVQVRLHAGRQRFALIGW